MGVRRGVLDARDRVLAAASGAARRYAGVCHIDVDSFDPDDVRAIMELHSLEISSLAYYRTTSPVTMKPAPRRTSTCER